MIAEVKGEEGIVMRKNTADVRKTINMLSSAYKVKAKG